MLLLAALSLSPASAKVAANDAMIACQPVFAFHVVPGASAEGVPVDVAPRVLLEGDCDAPSAHTLELVQLSDDGEQVVLSDEFLWDWDRPDSVLALAPEQALDESADFIFRVLPADGWGEVTEIGFSTGTDRVQGVEGVPTVELSSATWQESADQFALTLNLFAEGADDPDGLSTLHLLSPMDGEHLLVSQPADAGGPSGMFVTVFLDEAPEEEVCVEVVQMDGAGLLSAPGQACAEAEEIKTGLISRRCDTTGGAMSLIGLLMAGGLLGRRRR